MISEFKGRCVLASVLLRFGYTLKTDHHHKKGVSPKDKERVILKNVNRRQSASLSVEAALVLPIFFFCIYMLLQLFLLIMTELSIAERTTRLAYETGIMGYADRKLLKEKAGDLSYLYIPVIYEACSELDNVENEIVYSGKSEDGSLKLTVSYEYRILAPFMPGIAFHIKQDFFVRPFLGDYDPTENMEEIEDGKEEKTGGTVYVTENGEVYHLSLSCPYIHPALELVAFSKISDYRNSSGKKYKPCNVCGKEVPVTGLVYITGNGEKYHVNRECPALIRKVKEEKRTEAEEKGLRPCSRCGKKE